MDRDIIFSRDDLDLIVEFAGCTLNKSPGKNWVENNGGLPEYICQIARAIHRGGRPVGQAISIAVSRVKKWAAGADDVDADTRAKAAKALAQWEALKGKNKAKKAGKAAAGKGDKVEASNTDRYVLNLANVSFNIDVVRQAFDAQTSEARRAWRTANPNNYEDGPAYYYIKETWTDFLVVGTESGRKAPLYKVGYTVDKDMNVTFGDPVKVKTEYVVVKESALAGADLTDDTLKQAMDLSERADPAALAQILALTRR